MSPIARLGRRGFSAFAALFLICGWRAVLAAEQPALPPRPALLTNLFQLRTCAEQQPGMVHPIRVTAEVCWADCARGVLVLRDSMCVEFIALDLQGRVIEPGATVSLEADGYGLMPRGFGLALVRGVAVDNDGTHPVQLESGTVFLHAGKSPIRLEWFNGPKDAELNVEYEGPGLLRQRLPGTVLSHARVDAATGVTNFPAGLDFRCFEGAWDRLPDLSLFQPAKSGIAMDFDMRVRTRNENVALEFTGMIHIPREGCYTFYLASDDGARLWVGESSMDVRVTGQGPPPTSTEHVPDNASERLGRPWATLEGTVSSVNLRGSGGELQLRVGNDDIRVDVFESGDSTPSLPPRAKVKVSGTYEDVVTENGSSAPGVLRVGSWEAVRVVASGESLLTKALSLRKTAKEPVAEPVVHVTNAAPTIATVAEIKTLSRKLAEQQIPVSIRGVVTTCLPEYYGAVLQDSTRGIYVYLSDLKKFDLPVQRGEYYQVDGITGPGLFAPIVVARRISHLGAGQWPQALHATWAQLVNGSLDTQYAEIDGVVTAVKGQTLSMLMDGGKITLKLKGFRPEAIAAYLNAVVRVRGCVFAPFNDQTHELLAGTPLVGDAAVSVLQPAPGDLFDVPQKNVGDLLRYDPEAAPFRRLKISGQITHSRPGEYFISEGTNGVRVTTRNSDRFSVGDLVEAVGFLGLGGPAAELREAVLRNKGRAPLSPPTKLAPDQLLQAGHAGTLVLVEATLMNQWREGSEQVLELQSRFLAFRARLSSSHESLSLPATGSRLELTGVYAPLGNRAGDGTVSGFELLLHSPSGLRVLTMPQWWTLKRGFSLAGIMAALLCVALLWNKALHRQVRERTSELEKEIRHRERAEQQRAAEAERARIARDLHDELGAGLTEVSLLASAGLAEFRGLEQSNARFRAIAEKARALVAGLDVIVWAIDPRRNSLQSFADYVGSYAEELLSTSNIHCRFRIPIECGSVTLPGPARHSLFLAIKEALNNIIRHASATEVELRMTQFEQQLEIVIADNGCGFFWNAIRPGNGLANLQERLRALHGQCDIQSTMGHGTTVTFLVPFPNDSQQNIAVPVNGERSFLSTANSALQFLQNPRAENGADISGEPELHAAGDDAVEPVTPGPAPRHVP